MSKEKKEPSLLDVFNELSYIDELLSPTSVGGGDGFIFDLSQEPYDSATTQISQEITGKNILSTRSDTAKFKSESVHAVKLPTYSDIKNDHNASKRLDYRHHLRWQVIIVNKGGSQNDIYHGRTHNLSISGASIFIDYNIFFTSEIIVLLAIPPAIQ